MRMRNLGKYVASTLKRCFMYSSLLDISVSHSLFFCALNLPVFYFRDTVTSSGPNSFNKGKQGFTNYNKVREKEMKLVKQ